MAIVPVSPLRRRAYLHLIPASRQTLALKGFLVSSASVTGLVMGADNYLLKYESQQRYQENELRRKARNDLARQGIIATESEIRRWKQRKEAEIREAENAKE